MTRKQAERDLAQLRAFLGNLDDEEYTRLLTRQIRRYEEMMGWLV